MGFASQTAFFAVTNSLECALCGREVGESSPKPVNTGFSGVFEASQKSEDVSQKEGFAVLGSAEDTLRGRTVCEPLRSLETAGVEGVLEVPQKAGDVPQLGVFAVLPPGGCVTLCPEDGEADQWASSCCGASSGTSSVFVKTVFPVLGSVRMITFGRS